MSIIGGALISGGMGLAGSAMSGMFSQSSAREQWRSTKKLYKRRYQYTMQDLRDAGLNPMLAMSHGPGTPGQLQKADTPDFAGGMQKGVSNALAREQMKLARQQTDTAKAMELQQTATAAEHMARSRSANVEAAKGEMILRHWQKDPGLSTAAAFRDAYGTGVGPQAMTLGAGLAESGKTALDRTIEAFSSSARGIFDRSQSQKSKDKPRSKSPQSKRAKPKKGWTKRHGELEPVALTW